MENLSSNSAFVRYTNWVDRYHLGINVCRLAFVVMLLWAGAYKLTAPGADGIVPLVSTSPLISWLFTLFGRYPGSDIIGITEITSAILIVIGWFKPQAGMAGSLIATIIFTVTGTMVITAADSIVVVKGIAYMSFVGLFLFKDIVSLGVSFYLLSYYRQKAISINKIN
jgi:reactive chlorine resistance protein C